ncbi:MAG: S41 family peptidase, partial [Chloroflexota bacterium]|nr:S41 family peptidase [Chloroflexota bacterium]
MKALRYALLSVTLAVLVAVSFAAGARYGTVVFTWLNLQALQPVPLIETSSEPAAVAPTFSVFWQAWNVVTHNFVDSRAVDVQRMTYGAIRGMVDSLGDAGHTRFLTPDQFQHEQGELSGRFIGIGAEISVKNEVPVVVAPLDGSPAEKAGLRAGDRIVRIDGQEVSQLGLSEIINRIRGQAGTPVTLTVIHQGSDVLQNVTITRARIIAHPVSSALLPGYGIADIRIAQFSAEAANELKAAIKEAEDARAGGIVLDLRDNPGGILDQAVGSASLFLNQGTVVVIRDRRGHEERRQVQAQGLLTRLPLAVLINGGTASAAEIVAGAMADNHRATLVGQTSFGTGTVLHTFRLKDGSAILLGTSQWLTPDGQTIKDKGIKPAVEVRLPPASNALTPSGEKTMTAEQIAHSG